MGKGGEQRECFTAKIIKMVNSPLVPPVPWKRSRKMSCSPSKVQCTDGKTQGRARVKEMLIEGVSN